MWPRNHIQDGFCTLFVLLWELNATLFGVESNRFTQLGHNTLKIALARYYVKLIEIKRSKKRLNKSELFLSQYKQRFVNYLKSSFVFKHSMYDLSMIFRSLKKA